MATSAKSGKKSSKKASGAKKAQGIKVKAQAFKPKIPTVKDPLTKSGILKAIMDMTGNAKKDVVTTLEALADLIELHVKSRGPGKFTLPGLLKISVVKKPATPARKGINPFTGEETMFKAKPKRNVLKIRPLAKLKEMAV